MLISQLASSHPGITLDAATAAVNVAPGTPVGTGYTLTYRICEQLNINNCDSAVVTVEVGASLQAVPDTGSTAGGAAVTTPVLGNDVQLGGALDPASVTVVTPSPDGTTGVDPATGAVTFTPHPGFSGPTSYRYRVCLAPPAGAICDTALVSLNVAPSIAALDDDHSAMPIAGLAGGSTPSVLGNDRVNGAPAAVGGNASLFPGAPTVTPASGGIAMQADGRIAVLPGTSAGLYTLPYQICTLPPAMPPVCASALATLAVAAPPLQAQPDTANTVGNTPVATPVLANDSTSGGTLDTASVTVATPSPDGSTSVDLATGVITFTPHASFSGTTTYTYRVCLAPPYASVCDTAQVTVQVGATIAALDDDFTATPIGGGNGGSTPSVVANDSANGAAAVIGGNVSLLPGSATPAAGGIAMDAGGAIVVAPGTAAGRYSLPYRICTLPPTVPTPTCASATATLLVVAPTITAQADTASTFGNAPVITAVLANDSHVGGAIDPASVGVTAPSPHGSTSVDPATGDITFTPNPGFSGDTRYGYRVCLAAPNAAVCASATVDVRVSNIDALDDDFSAAPVNGATGGSTASVLANDLANGAAVVPGGNAALFPGSLSAVPAAGSIAMQPDGRILVAAGTSAGSYRYGYQICLLPATVPPSCDSASATLVVAAPAIAPQPDVVEAALGTPIATPVLANDQHTGGTLDPASVSVTTPSPNGSLTVDPATGAIVFTPHPGFTGSTGYGYQVCLAAPYGQVCGSASVTVNVTGIQVLKALTGESGRQAGLAEAGETLTYTITLRNPGPVPASGYTLVDQLGAGLSFVSASQGGVAAGQAITWTGLTVPAQGSLALQLVASVVRPLDSTQVRNLARGLADPEPECPGAACVVLATAADVTARKRLAAEEGGREPGLAEFGETLHYRIALANAGGTAFDGYRFTEHVPPGATLTAVSGAAGFTGPVAGPATVALSVPSVPARGSAEVAIAFRIADAPPAGQREIVNLIDGGDLDPACGPDCRVATPLQQPAQLSLIKAAAVREARIGDLVRYTVRIANAGTVDYVGGSIVDTPPQGFVYVPGSMAVADRDQAFALGPGTHPLTIGGIDVAAGEEAVVTYLLRVGAGVRHGVHANQVRAVDRAGQLASNVAEAQVTVVADPLLDESLVLGTVFDDRDGDGWQDPASLTGVQVQGGFAPEAYVPGSTTVGRGLAPQPVPDADGAAPLLRGLALGRIEGRQSDADDPDRYSLVVHQHLSTLLLTGDFVLTSREGLTVRMDAAGNTRVDRSGDAARSLNGAEPHVTRTIAVTEAGYVVEYLVGNHGIDERGLPGVRVASAQGLLMETDPYGRYHLLGVDGGHWVHGRNFVLKIDPSTLPDGSRFTTPNPLVRRITPGMPVRFDFGVQQPVYPLGPSVPPAAIVLGRRMFAPGEARLAPDQGIALSRLVDRLNACAGQCALVADDSGAADMAQALARLSVLRTALLQRLMPASARGLQAVVRSDADDPRTLLAGWSGRNAVVGTLLFDNEAAAVHPRHTALMRQLAREIEAEGSGRVDIVGDDGADGALRLARAQQVHAQLAPLLSPEARAQLHVYVQGAPLVAPGGPGGER